MFRHERSFTVVRKELRNPMFAIQKDLNLAIGGFMGMAVTESNSHITVEKDQFYPGEEIKVKIECDNTKCKRDVKFFKIKIQRKILALGYDGNYSKHSRYVTAFKLLGGC